MDAANNAGVVPQERACIHALTHTAPESLPNNDIDDAYVRLCKTFGGDRTNYEPLHTMPDGILTIRGFMWRIYELFTDCECRDDCTGMVAAADAAADALRTALKAGTASYCTMYLAFKILQFLPPFISVRHHAVVAEMLADGSPDIMAFAAHTLACMGPEAVAEHFEEIVSIAGADPGTSVVTHRFSYASAAAAGMLVRNECTPAAWLCVCVLEPAHLARLECRGAPVSAIAKSSVFRGAHDEILVGHGWPYFRVPAVADVLAALEASPRARTPAGCALAAHPNDAIVVDKESSLSSYTPSEIAWSPAGHSKFPRPARMRVHELLLIGAAIARLPLALPLDLFVDAILPFVIRRRSSPGGVGEARTVAPTMQRKFALDEHVATADALDSADECEDRALEALLYN